MTKEPFIIINGERLSNIFTPEILSTILILGFIYLIVDLIQGQIRLNKQSSKLEKSRKDLDFYEKKLKETKTPKDFEKLQNWMDKNKESLYYG